MRGSKKSKELLRKRPIRSGVTLSILVVAAIFSFFLLPPVEEIAPIQTPAQIPKPQARPETPVHPAKEFTLEGVIVRSSGDTNPLLGTPWISVGCFGYIGEPVIAIDIEILDIYKPLKGAGLKCGQNIVYTGQEEKPKGTTFNILIQWEEGGEKMSVDAGQIVYDKKTGKSLNELNAPFVFLGSYICAGELEGETTGCIACTVNCPKALFAANKDDSGYYNERSRYYVPEGILPEPGTKVTVILTWA